MKKKEVESKIGNHPDLVFFDGRVMPPPKGGHRVSARPVNMDILPSFGEVELSSADEQLDTKVFYVDDKDLKFIDKK